MTATGQPQFGWRELLRSLPERKSPHPAPLVFFWAVDPSDDVLPARFGGVFRRLLVPACAQEDCCPLETQKKLIMITPFAANGLPVLIGSLPLNDHQEALDWIFAATPEIPLWPQLPGNPLEQMMPQFAEGIPCIREENLRSPSGRILYDVSGSDFEFRMLAFYEDCLAVQERPEKLAHSRFRVSRERAEGLHVLAEVPAWDKGCVAVKGQVTGPFTMLTGIKDSQGRAGYYDDVVRDMVVKGISLKAAWQTQFLAKRCGRRAIVFIDEPALAGLGSSAFISVSAAAVQEMINEVAGAIRGAGGLAGIHVCANTEWEMLFSADIDILSFDAYNFFDKATARSEQVHQYLDRGAILAWGGVPTSRAEDVEKEDAASMVRLWEQQMQQLVRPDRDLTALLRQTLITPSCGTGSLSREHARKVLSMTKSASDILRERHLA